jgi:hypothetical protein
MPNLTEARGILIPQLKREENTSLYPRSSALGMMAYYWPQAGKTRREVFDRFCEEPTIKCATHFPAPSTGRVRWGDGFKFVGAAD